ncbi:hypothetical protein L1275_001104 [Flavobacterium sp. HSC-61S13]|nr:hypothetical protein [Flavobacterium sp. HSC-61S13]
MLKRASANTGLKQHTFQIILQNNSAFQLFLILYLSLIDEENNDYKK